ncbi:MAG: hypothetical protein H0T46_35785 [Deltaproteobacteria bacterium]|nr:hypothetical protein [Deltaproteobacteria bacterium]
MEFIRAGGFNMFILLALGLVTIPTAVMFARNASAHRLSILRALSWALLAATLTGFVSGLAATCHYVANDPEALKEPLPYLLVGFAESTANLVLGGGIAAITWILVAVGVRRMPQDNS